MEKLIYCVLHITSELSSFIDFDEIEMKEGIYGSHKVRKAIWRNAEITAKRIETDSESEKEKIRKEIQLLRYIIFFEDLWC